MYPWYKDNHPISVSKYYNSTAPAPVLSNIKKESGGGLGGFRDCMVSLDYACHNKVKVVVRARENVFFDDHKLRSPTKSSLH